MARSKPDVARQYQRAREQVARTEQRELTAKEFLDTVDPRGNRSAKSARDYIRRIAKGERSGKVIKRRADSMGGKLIQVPLVDDNGNVVDSAIVAVPLGHSSFDLYRGKGVRSAVNRYMRARKQREDAQAFHAADTHYRWRTNSKGLKIGKPRAIRNTKKSVAILRG
jgi:hypothetical protein